jgi:3'-5' exoribonuclease
MDVRMTRANKQYQSFTFQDQTGEINGNLWDSNEKTIREFVPGVVVYLMGHKELYQNVPQVNQIRIRKAAESEPNNPLDYQEKPPINPKDLEETLNKYIFEIKNANLQRIVRLLIGKHYQDFFSYPAAKMNHHAFPTGLAFHTVSMLNLAKAIVDLYPATNQSLLYSGIILHDLGKVVELSGSIGTEYTLSGMLLGHITIIDEEIIKGCLELNINDQSEEVLLLRHLILAHHGKNEYGSPVVPQIMEAEILHLIDNLDAKIQMITAALKPIASGERSGKIFALDNRQFYKGHI